MNYIELINKFWTLNREYSFNASETALYFHLLNVANSLSWKNPFREATGSITATIGLSKSTIQRSRDMLVKAGLIEFEAGKVKRELTTYKLLGDHKNTQSVPQSDTQNDTQSVPQSDTQNDTNPSRFIKHKENKTKLNKKREDITRPEFEVVASFFLENNRPQSLARKFYDHYGVEWTDARGNKVKNWKQKARTVWFNDENEEKEKSCGKKESRVQTLVTTAERVINEFNQTFTGEF